MKKFTKTLVALACVATLGAGIGAMAACNNPDDSGDKTPTTKTGEAYGLVHGAGYVGYSTVTLEDGNIKNVTLTEVCFPTQVSATGTSTESAEAALTALTAQIPTGMTADDFAVVQTEKDGTYTAQAYYKTVSYGEVTMTYDMTDGYKVGSQTLKEYFKTEANCKAYYEAVVGGKVKASGKDGVMTKTALCKDDNGYWTCDKKEDGTWDNHPSKPYSADAYSRWKWNRDATVKYVVDNGVAGLLTLTRSETNNGKDSTGADVKMWVDSNGVVTGATWTDFNTQKEGSLSYAQIITNAYNAAK